MKVSFLLFVIGIVLIVMGITNQMKPTCKERVVVKYVPRQVYDEIHLKGLNFTENSE